MLLIGVGILATRSCTHAGSKGAFSSSSTEELVVSFPSSFSLTEQKFCFLQGFGVAVKDQEPLVGGKMQLSQENLMCLDGSWFSNEKAFNSQLFLIHYQTPKFCL